MRTRTMHGLAVLEVQYVQYL